MKLQARWDEQDGIVTCGPNMVRVEVVVRDRTDHTVEKVPELTLWNVGVTPEIPIEWHSGPYASAAVDLPPESSTPVDVCWQLRLGQSVVATLEATLVAPHAESWRISACIVMALSFSAITALISAVASVSSFLSTLPAVLVAGLLATARRRIARCLLTRWVSRTIVGVGIVGAGFIYAHLTIVQNQTPEARQYDGHSIPPKESRLVWKSRAPNASAAVAAPKDVGPGALVSAPYDRADLSSWLDWWPWLRFEPLVCDKISVPRALREQWQAAGTCRPPVLEARYPICKAETNGRRTGLAHVAFDVNRARDWKLVEPSTHAPCWPGGELSVTFAPSRSFDVTAIGFGATRRLEYPRPLPDEGEPAPDDAWLTATHAFEFNLNGAKAGTVRLETSEGLGTSHCAYVDNRAGIAAISLRGQADLEGTRTQSGEAKTRTEVEHPYWVQDVPICFPRQRPAEGEVTFAPGWVPQGRQIISWPLDSWPTKLTLRAAEGDWLGTMEVDSGKPFGIEPDASGHLHGEISLEAHAVSWSDLGSAIGSVRWSTESNGSSVYVEVPPAPRTGGVAWTASRSSETMAIKERRLTVDKWKAVPFTISIDPLAQVRPARPGVCYFDRQNVFVERTCKTPAPKEPAPPEQAEKAARVRCSSRRYCDDPPVETP